jgi:hypothetical protein
LSDCIKIDNHPFLYTHLVIGQNVSENFRFILCKVRSLYSSVEQPNIRQISGSRSSEYEDNSFSGNGAIYQKAVVINQIPHQHLPFLFCMYRVWRDRWLERKFTSVQPETEFKQK